MKTLVLSLTKKLKKTDKTEYLDKFDVLKTSGNSVEVREIFDNSLLMERELKKAVKEKYDFVVVSSPLEGKSAEDAFRSKFAYIIPRAERKIQKVPKAKKKGFRKKDEEIETVTYQRKKTHVFPLELSGCDAFTFAYLGLKVVFIPDNITFEALKSITQKALDAFAENEESYPEGYSLRDRSVRVLTFFERHFPIRSDPKSEKIRKSVMLTAMCAFIVAAYLFVQNIYLIPLHNSSIISEIQTVFYDGQSSSGKNDANKITKKNWKKLKKINKEIVGWVKINNTRIDYPVLWHKGDNAYEQFYLWRNYKKEYIPGGTTSIFLDWRSKKGMESKNVILHGHHMEDGTMFADLLKYGGYTGNLKFYKKSPVITISTPKGGTQTYKIFSIFKSNVDNYLGEYFDFYCAKFKNDPQFLNYVYNLKIRSLINCPVSVNEDDQLLSLVTCSYEFGWGSNFRTIIVARKCRKGENEEVDVNSASVNKKSVWPQCYYSRFGGKRPTVSTFRNEYKKGKLSWYDGSYKAKGSEQLPTSYTVPTLPPIKKTTTAPTSATTKATQATTKPKTTSKPTSSKPKTVSKPKVQTYTIRVFTYNPATDSRTNMKPVIEKKVKAGTLIKLPRIKEYEKDGYKYSLKKWKVKIAGVKKPRYLKKTTGKIKINVSAVVRAVYKKTKVVVPTQPTTKPKTSSAPKTTKPTKPAATDPKDED